MPCYRPEDYLKKHLRVFHKIKNLKELNQIWCLVRSLASSFTFNAEDFRKRACHETNASRNVLIKVINYLNRGFVLTEIQFSEVVIHFCRTLLTIENKVASFVGKDLPRIFSTRYLEEHDPSSMPLNNSMAGLKVYMQVTLEMEEKYVRELQYLKVAYEGMFTDAIQDFTTTSVAVEREDYIETRTAKYYTQVQHKCQVLYATIERLTTDEGFVDEVNESGK